MAGTGAHGVPPNPGGTADLKMLRQAEQALRAGDAQRALDLSDAFILLNSKHAEALHLGGMAALRLGRIDKAVARLREAAMLRPRHAEGLADFGRALDKAGNRTGAEAAFRAALTLEPTSVAAMTDLGRLLEDFGRDADAAKYYRAAVQQAESAEGQVRVARIELKLMRPAEALAAARRALKLKRDLPEALWIAGSALDAMGHYDEAVASRQELIRLRPKSGSGHYDLGMTHMHHGHLKEAAESFRAAIALEPERGAWHRALSFLVGHKARDAEMDAMARVHRSNSASDDDRMHAGFGMGKALEDAGAYDEAFRYFLEANRLKRATLRYSDDETDRLFDKMKAVFTPERFAAHAGSGSPDPTPIFVLGMPRSGTSLVEQVLASHPEVAGGGEFRLLNQLVGSIAGGPGFPLGEALDAISEDKLRELGEAYVAQVRGLSPTARFITDKLPGNFIMIGMIRLILPNARVIHCTRDAVDTSLSIFKNFFAAENLRYAYSLEEIGHYHRRYLDLMAHWHTVLPGFVYDISYEGLVADFEAEGRRLLEHCDLDWREENRNFFNARRSVQTASSVQVRRPIYSSSIGHGERYGDRIAPLLKALGR